MIPRLCDIKLKAVPPLCDHLIGVHKTVEADTHLEPLLMRMLSRMVSVQKYHTNRKLNSASRALRDKS